MPNSTFLLDTGPVSVLCGFPFTGLAYMHEVLAYTDIMLPEGVMSEIQAAHTGKIARTVMPLIKDGTIKVYKPVSAPPILDSAYGKVLGLGERSTIKSMLESGIPGVIDDKDAFIVACRFGLHPIGFHDFIVRLVLYHNMSKSIAIEIIKITSRQYPNMFLTHTLDMLS